MGPTKPGRTPPPQLALPEASWATEAGRAGATHRGLVFVEHLVIAAERGCPEDDGRGVLEAVDPLLALRRWPPTSNSLGRQESWGGGRETPAGVGTLVGLRGQGGGCCAQQASQGASPG